MTECQVAIVGAGPSGITCAVQLLRMGVTVKLFEAERAGGTIRLAWRVENFPVMPAGGPGEEIARRFEEHLAAFDIVPVCARIRRILVDSRFRLQTDEDSYDAQAVVLACGLTPLTLTEPPELTPFLWQGAELPPPCEEGILVIGGGDVAFDQAGRLASAGFNVTLVHRSTRLKALARIVDAAREVGVTIRHSSEPQWKIGATAVRRGDLPQDGPFRYVLPCIGREARPPSVVSDSGRVPLVPISAFGETKQPGLFVVGDLAHGRNRQVSIAMGDGMLAALELAQRFEAVEPIAIKRGR